MKKLCYALILTFLFCVFCFEPMNVNAGKSSVYVLSKIKSDSEIDTYEYNKDGFANFGRTA